MGSKLTSCTEQKGAELLEAGRGGGSRVFIPVLPSTMPLQVARECRYVILFQTDSVLEFASPIHKTQGFSSSSMSL